jgi:hypothetical protein
MPQGTPISAEQRDAVIMLARTGMPRNEVARRLTLSRSTVSKVCAAAGIDFDRSATEKASLARQADNKARRVGLVDKLYTKAEQLLAQIDHPHIVFNIGGKDNTYTEHLLDRPPTGDIRNLMQSASIALQRAEGLENIDASAGVDGAKSLLGELGRALGIGSPDATA